jgi:hypothetical protein
MNTRTRKIFQDLAAASVKISVFWDVAPYSLIDNNRRFRGSYCRPSSLKCPSVSARINGVSSQNRVILKKKENSGFEMFR